MVVSLGSALIVLGLFVLTVCALGKAIDALYRSWDDK